MNKQRVLRLIKSLETRAKGPEQGSTEWLRVRQPHGGKKRGRVGGSEIGSLMGKNFFKPAKELMLEKLGKAKPKIPETIHCYFGILFEAVAVACFEQVYNTTVLCKDISLIDSNMENFIFSPDGLCPMPVNDEGKILLGTEGANVSKYVPVLIEIKCPLTRKVIDTPSVPSSYMAQIQAGLICIEMAHAAIFIDNCFRVCSLEDIGVPRAHNLLVHGSHRTPAVDEQKIGAILIKGDISNIKFQTKPKVTSIDHEGDEGYREFYDFGGSTHDVLLALLLCVRDKRVKFEYLPPCEPNCAIDLDAGSKEGFNGVVGIIYWKLFKTSHTLVYKDTDMNEEIKNVMSKYNSGNLDNLFFSEGEEDVLSIRQRLSKNKV